MTKENNKKVFIICTVRGASNEYRAKLEAYVKDLEYKGYIVHLPHRDTKQDDTGINICTNNMNAIRSANEVHVFYNPDSTGTHFDLGGAFALDKKLVVVENVDYGEGKSFPRMIDEWEANGNDDKKEI